jgi:hypothetical protein
MDGKGRGGKKEEGRRRREEGGRKKGEGRRGREEEGGKKGREEGGGKKGGKLIASFPFLNSFSGPHIGHTAKVSGQKRWRLLYKYSEI